MIETLTFDEIVRLINYSRTTEIDAEPHEVHEGWSIYRGRHKIRTSTYPFFVLYLGSRTTHDHIADANSGFPRGEVHVVYPPSLRQRLIVTRELFPGCSGLFTTREYLASFIADEIKIYLKAVSEQKPAHYIDPRIETPSGFPRKIPNPIQSLLLDPPSEHAQGSQGVLAILLAEPGQGKTYMSRYLVSQISTFRGANAPILVPILVNSTQWHDMPLEDLSSLNKTIVNSFRHFGASIGWIEDHEEEFLRTTLKADLFRIVFDGFDEYILRNRGVIQPVETLEALSHLATDTGSRIVITSRTSFWQTTISTAQAEEFVGAYGALIYRILPFDLEHAKNYFQQRLSDSSLRERAIAVFAILIKRNAGLVGRGFVLNLIADLIEALPASRRIEPKGSAGLLWLMEAFCERDVLRQGLPLDSAQQMRLFRTVAIEMATGAQVTSDLLDLCISEVADNLTAEERKACAELLRPHPLLPFNPETKTWEFKVPQILTALLADQLVRWRDNRISDFFSKVEADPGFVQDLGEMVVDLIADENSDVTSDASKIITALSSGKERRLAAVVALMATERMLPHGSELGARSRLLVKLCGGDSVRLLDFTGTIARFDFSEISFKKCRFENVSWANCIFSPGTVFEECEFLGGTLAGRVRGFGTVTLTNSKRDAAAFRCFNSAQISEGNRVYSVDDLRQDIHALVSKFVSKGGVALKKVAEPNLSKGIIGSSRFREEIISMFILKILAKHHISGRDFPGYHLRPEVEEAVRFYAANNVFTGALRELFEALQSKLLG